jgi:hypothetical protein
LQSETLPVAGCHSRTYVEHSRNDTGGTPVGMMMAFTRLRCWDNISDEDAVKAGGFLTGTPDDIIEQLKTIEKRYPGLDRVVCSMGLGTPLRGIGAAGPVRDGGDAGLPE